MAFSGLKCAKRLLSATLIVTVVCFFSLLNSLTVVNNKSAETIKQENRSRDYSTEESKQPNRSTESAHGYMLASSYSDQMTGSMFNLVSMQCLASRLGSNIRVVEPFLQRSIFGVNLCDAVTNDNENDNDSVRLRDVYNIVEWLNTTGKRGFSTLVTWEDFLWDAPSRMILVDRKCIKEEDGAGMKCMYCHQEFLQSIKIFAAKHGFVVVRKVCFPKETFTKSQFRRIVYGRNDPSKVVVLFRTFGGVEIETKANYKYYRVSINDTSECLRANFFPNMPSNSKVLEDSARYVQKYLPDAKGYISVMVRMEYFAIRHNIEEKSREEVLSLIKKCYSSIVEEVNKLKREYKLKSILLTMDTGKYGSIEFMKGERKTLEHLMTKSTSNLYHMLFENSSSTAEWEKTFEEMASFNNPGYVAMLQQHLAANGTCLLTAGGGVFQEKARALYSKYHSNFPKCVHPVLDC